MSKVIKDRIIEKTKKEKAKSRPKLKPVIKKKHIDNLDHVNNLDNVEEIIKFNYQNPIDTSTLPNVECYMYTSENVNNLVKYFNHYRSSKSKGLSIKESTEKAISILDDSEYIIEYNIYFGYPYFVQCIINFHTREYTIYKNDPTIPRYNTNEGYFDDVLKNDKEPIYLELRKSLDIIKNIKSNKYDSNSIIMSILSSNLNSDIYVNLFPKPLFITEYENSMLNIDIIKVLEDIPTFEDLYGFSNHM